MRRAAGLLLLGCLASSCGGGDGAESAGPVTVELSPRGDGPSGTATLTPTSGSSFSIELQLDPTFDGAGSHIHNISCAEYGDRPFADGRDSIFVEIAPVVNGKAENDASIPLEAVLKGGYSINVHATDPPYLAVACGEIEKQP